MKHHSANLPGLRILYAFLCLVALTAVPAMAFEPGWDDVPQRLKTEDGAARKTGFLYATGTARAEDIRLDKAHEMARKKSQLTALQILRTASSCQELLSSLDGQDNQQFLRLFAPLWPSLHMEGVRVIRQWEDGQDHFTTVAAPLAGLEMPACPFDDLAQAILSYLQSDPISIEGLAFCLRHTARHTRLGRIIRDRVGRVYMERGETLLARSFLPDPNRETVCSGLEVLSLQNRLQEAEGFARRAAQHAKEGQWDEALMLASQSLDLVPTYTNPYLTVSDFFLHRVKRPEFALCAAQKALRDGTCFQDAVDRIVSAMQQLGIPEKGAFQYLLSRIPTTQELCYPVDWKGVLDRFPQGSVPYMVMVSAGQAIEGDSQPAGPAFDRAMGRYEQAKDADGVSAVLDLLGKVCENHPLSADTYNLMGACYRYLGQPAVALPFLWQAAGLKPDYDYALANLGICCQNLGLTEAARYYFEQQAVKKSSNSWVRERYVKYRSSGAQKELPKNRNKDK
jgi:tetratricopeptide (TPR) repeat protein